MPKKKPSRASARVVLVATDDSLLEGQRVSQWTVIYVGVSAPKGGGHPTGKWEGFPSLAAALQWCADSIKELPQQSKTRACFTIGSYLRAMGRGRTFSFGPGELGSLKPEWWQLIGGNMRGGCFCGQPHNVAPATAQPAEASASDSAQDK